MTGEYGFAAVQPVIDLRTGLPRGWVRGMTFWLEEDEPLDWLQPRPYALPPITEKAMAKKPKPPRKPKPKGY